MSLNEKYGYTPYKGGAVPTMDETAALNDLLLRACQDEGLDVYMDSDIDGTFIIVGDRRVNYDRWGYCDHEEGDLDQGSLEDAVSHLCNWVKK
jgi:hypothetical protein